MENENRIEETGNMETDYLAAIKELKQNTVSKEDYLKLKQENKQLLSSLVNGETLDNPAKENRISTEELRANYEKLALGNTSNLEYWQTVLDLRDRDIEEGRPDPFLPYSHNYTIQQSDIDSANKVAAVVRECIEYADGNSAVFTNELQRRTNDTRGVRRK